MSSTSTVSELRPLAMGEMIDRSATFWRAHLKPLFVLNLGFSLVNYIAMKSTVLAIQRMAPELFTGDAQTRAQQDLSVLTSQGSAFAGLWSVLVVFLIWLYWMAMLAVSRYVVGSQLGEPVRPGQALRRSLSRAGTLTGVYLVSLAWFGLMTVLMVGPGAILGLLAALAAGQGFNYLTVVLALLAIALGGLGLIAAMLWYFLRFLLLPPVLAMEDLGVWESFQRSGALLSGRVEPGFLGRVVVRAMILFTVVSLILLSVGIVSGMPSWLVMAPYGNPFDLATMARTPQYLLVPADLLQLGAQAVFTPVSYVFCALFYLDMRVRREALDLERRLETPPSPTLAV